MQQYQNGKKVQNWHRPLGANELKQRYVQRQYADPIYPYPTHYTQQVNKDDECFYELMPDDNMWDSWDEWYYSYCDNYVDDVPAYQLTNQIENLLVNPNLADYFKALGFNYSANDAVIKSKNSTIILELSLFNYYQSINNDTTQVLSNIDYTYITACRVIGSQFGVTIAKNLLIFHKFWLRLPLTWQGNTIESLLDHVFGQYSAPSVLYSVWSQDYDADNARYYYWFILCAQGGSLKRAAKLFSWNLVPHLQHHLFTVPSNFKPNAALRYVEIILLGGDEQDFNVVESYFVTYYGHLYKNLDLRASYDNESKNNLIQFWYNTVRWIIKHRKNLSTVELNAVLTWVQHLNTEASRKNAPFFNWQSSTYKTYLAKANDYHRTIAERFPRRLVAKKSAQPFLTWSKHGWGWSFKDENNERWVFTELNSSDSLNEEGVVLHHCVGNYAGVCVKGYSAIISLRRDNKSLLTIEVEPLVNRVAQVHGDYNRLPSESERTIVRQWCRHFNLSWYE